MRIHLKMAIAIGACTALAMGCSSKKNPNAPTEEELAEQGVDEGPDTGTDDGGGDDGGGNGGGNNPGDIDDAQNADCLSDVLVPPSGDSCTCEYTSCDAQEISCSCPTSCYGDPTGCDIVCPDPSQPCTTSDSELGDALGGCSVLTCVPENDLSTEQSCSASDCVEQVVDVVVDPTAPAAPAPAAVDTARAEINASGILATIDVSGSMASWQCASANAITAFENTLALDAEFSMTVQIADTAGLTDGNGDPITGAEPGAVIVTGPCTAQQCACGDELDAEAVDCSFDEVAAGDTAGTITNTDGTTTAEALEVAKRAFVLGEDPSVQGNGTPGTGGASDHDEGGAETATFHCLALIRQGLPCDSQVIHVSDESLNNDEEQTCDAQARRYDPTSLSFIRDAIPAYEVPCDPVTGVCGNTGNCDTDLTLFYSDFFAHYGCIDNPSVWNPGPCSRQNCICDLYDGSCDICESVAGATQGLVTDIASCPMDPFFESLALTTSTLSTGACFQGLTLDSPADAELTFDDGSGIQVVPYAPGCETTGDPGWTWDNTTSCAVLCAEWTQAFGDFSMAYDDGTTGPAGPPTACFDTAVHGLPILSTLVVTAVQTGEVIPETGYTYGAGQGTEQCVTFNGTYAEGLYLDYQYSLEFTPLP